MTKIETIPEERSRRSSRLREYFPTVWNNTPLHCKFRGGAAKFGFISITYHKYILGVYKYILRLEISIFDCKNR